MRTKRTERTGSGRGTEMNAQKMAERIVRLGGGDPYAGFFALMCEQLAATFRRMNGAGRKRLWNEFSKFELDWYFRESRYSVAAYVGRVTNRNLSRSNRRRVALPARAKSPTPKAQTPTRRSR